MSGAQPSLGLMAAIIAAGAMSPRPVETIYDGYDADSFALLPRTRSLPRKKKTADPAKKAARKRQKRARAITKGKRP